MKTKLLLVGFILAIIGFSCSTPTYLPKSKNVHVNQYGSYIKIKQKEGNKIKGELLSIDSAQLIVLTDIDKNTKKALVIPIDKVSHFKVKYARPLHYGWTIPLYTLSTILHGYFMVLTTPVNLFVTVFVTVSGENAFLYTDKEMTYEKLKMFARYPQGIPPNIDIITIK